MAVILWCFLSLTAGWRRDNPITMSLALVDIRSRFLGQLGPFVFDGCVLHEFFISHSRRDDPELFRVGVSPRNLHYSFTVEIRAPDKGIIYDELELVTYLFR